MKRYPGIIGLQYTETEGGTHYKTGPFHFQVDGNAVVITKDTEKSILSLNIHQYRTADEAEEMAWSMARKQCRA